MAKTTRAETARRNTNHARVNRGMYVEGNTVRRLAEVPERRHPGRPQQPGRITEATAKDRRPVETVRHSNTRRRPGNHIS